MVSMHRVFRLGLLVTAVAALSIPVVAQDDARTEGEGEPTPNIADLLDRIERLEDDKVQMQDEIDELRAQSGDTWLTEARAEQIKELVEDVLTDADTRTSLLQDGATAGWDGKFFLASADGRFRLNVGGQLQFRWIWDYHDFSPDYVYGFENTRTKVVFSGYVFGRDLTYKIQGDFGAQDGTAGDYTLQDAWMRWMLNSDWSLRFGQFKLPYNHEFLVDSMYQQVIERSLVSQRGNLGRAPGIELTYGGRHHTFAVALSNGGEFNVAPSPNVPLPSVVANVPLLINSAPGNNTDYAVTARYQRKFAGTWDQFSQMTSPPGEGFGLMWGVAGHYQRTDPHTAGTTNRDHAYWVAVTSDVTVNWGGANLFSSLVYNYFDTPNFNTNVWGWTLQGGMYFTEKFEGYARVEWGRFIINGEPFLKDLAVVTIGGNYYIDGQDLKLSADVGFGLNPVSPFWNSDQAGWRVDPAGVRPQIVLRTQFQLLF